MECARQVSGAKGWTPPPCLIILTAASPLADAGACIGPEEVFPHGPSDRGTGAGEGERGVLHRWEFAGEAAGCRVAPAGRMGREAREGRSTDQGQLKRLTAALFLFCSFFSFLFLVFRFLAPVAKRTFTTARPHICRGFKSRHSPPASRPRALYKEAALQAVEAKARKRLSSHLVASRGPWVLGCTLDLGFGLRRSGRPTRRRPRISR